MERSWYVAARDGDTGFIDEARVQDIETGYLAKLVAKTPQNNNILHIPCLHNQVDFINYILTLLNPSLFITLISQKNVDGETPLHIASKKGNVGIVHLIVNYCKMNDVNAGSTETRYYQMGEIEVAEGGDDELRWRPWRVRNSEGNTALHEAIIHCKIEVARYLVILDEEHTCFVNNRKETPLHLAAKCNVKDDRQSIMDTIEQMNKQNASLRHYKACKYSTNAELLSMIKLLVNINNASIYMYDEDGMTPLLRASIESNFSLIHLIITEFPDSIQVRDFKGHTILHLIKTINYDDAKSLLEIPEVLCLRDQQDYMGNTPAFAVVKDIIDNSQSEMYSQVGLSGNTRAFVVVKDISTGDFDKSRMYSRVGLLKALLTSSANFSIRNKEGLSAAALIQQYKSIFSNVTKIEVTQLDDELKTSSQLSTSNEEEKYLEMIREAIQTKKILYLTQNINTLGNDSSYYGLVGGGNILHAILNNDCNEIYDENDDDGNYVEDYELLSFVEKILEIFPTLLFQGDSKGDTPLHLIVRDHKITVSFLNQIDSYFEKCQEELSGDEEFYCSPWTLKNVKGNTPLHEVLGSSSTNINKVVEKLKYDTSLFEIVNNQEETPLHVLCGRTAKSNEISRVEENVILDVLDAYKFGAYKRDKDNLTPLLRAAKCGNIEEVGVICKHCPESAQLRDDKGKTFWHVIVTKVSPRDYERESMDRLIRDERMKELLHVKDDDGNTPVKVALDERNYHLLKALKPCPNVYAEVDRILSQGDFDDQFLITIIRCANHLPYTLEHTVCKILNQMPNKSFFGVLESEITAYSSSLAVIAVLLATIAFTAAFTVPGGFRQEHAFLNNNLTSVPFTFTPSGKPDNCNNQNISSDLIGTPVVLGSNLIPFLTRAAYWVFMVSDVLTMCLSTFVIYCQLWIMKSTQLRGVLIDMSIFTLMMSFYTTMITFMMGVYITTLRVDSSLAYFTLVVCSIVMLFMNRGLFPTKHCFLVFATAYETIAQTIEQSVKVFVYFNMFQWKKKRYD